MNEREQTIREYLALVKKIARRLKRLVPTLDLDDLVGDGSVGLIRAVDSFDPQRGTSMRQYARRLVAGAMLNGIRRMDPVSERARRIARNGEIRRYATALVTGTIPTAAEMEGECPGFRRALAATRCGQPLSLDARLPDGEKLSPDWSDDPAAIVEANAARSKLMALLDALPARQRRVVFAHYFAGDSLRAIGRVMSISAQRASQLHVAALASLRGQLDVAAR